MAGLAGLAGWAVADMARLGLGFRLKY
jgi:hypothetical protein